jgi:hypothetical protein
MADATASVPPPPLESLFSYHAARLPQVCLVVLALSALRRLREQPQHCRAWPARLGLPLLALALAALALFTPDAHPLSPLALQGLLGSALLLPLAPLAAVLPPLLLAPLRALLAAPVYCARAGALVVLLSWGYCAALGAAGLAHDQLLRALRALPCTLPLRALLAAPLACAASWRSLRLAALAFLPDACALACAGAQVALERAAAAGPCGRAASAAAARAAGPLAEPLAALALLAGGAGALGAGAALSRGEWLLLLGCWAAELAVGRAAERWAAREWAGALERNESGVGDTLSLAAEAAAELQRRWPWSVQDVVRLCRGAAGQREHVE